MIMTSSPTRTTAFASNKRKQHGWTRYEVGRFQRPLPGSIHRPTRPATNNVSERALRPSVIFRKVTNGFRSPWGADAYAAFRSVVSTAKANRRSVLHDLRQALGATSPHTAVTQPG
jgi:hypothetical protein